MFLCVFVSRDSLPFLSGLDAWMEGEGKEKKGKGEGGRERGGKGRNHLYLSCFTPSWLLTISSPVSVILMGPPNTILSAPYGKPCYYHYEKSNNIKK